MRLVEPTVYLTGQTQLNAAEVKRWLEDLGCGGYVDQFELDSDTSITDAEHLVGLAGKRCYLSFEPGMNPNVTKVRKNWHDYFENILKSGHGSVLEHATFNFAIENVSRVFTAEMNRHRAGVAISEQSMRYVRFTDIPFWFPPSIQAKDYVPPTNTCSCYKTYTCPDCLLRIAYQDREKQKSETRRIFENAIAAAETAYAELQRLWDFDNMKDFHTKKQITSLIRRIVPIGVATGAVYSMNFRALRHIVALRSSSAAEEEMIFVMAQVAKIMVKEAPLAFQDFEVVDGFWSPKYVKV